MPPPPTVTCGIAAGRLGAELAGLGHGLRLRDLAFVNTRYLDEAKPFLSPTGLVALAEAALPALPRLSLHYVYGTSEMKEWVGVSALLANNTRLGARVRAIKHAGEELVEELIRVSSGIVYSGIKAPESARSNLSIA